MFKMYRGLVSVLALSIVAQGCGLSREHKAASPSSAAVEQGVEQGAPAAAAYSAVPEPAAAEPAPQPLAEDSDDGTLEAAANLQGIGAARAGEPQKLLAPQAPPPANASPSAMAASSAGRIAADMMMEKKGGGAAVMSRSRRVAAKPTSVLQGPVAQAQPGDFNTEAYEAIEESPFVAAKDTPLSTFSIDVDTASYSNVRRFLAQGQLPPSGAVRVEEMVNYFPYEYAQPSGDAPFSVTSEVSQAPWNPKHQLLLVGLQGKHVAAEQLPSRNLVFLLDVSGSMNDPNKLPLLKRSLGTLVSTLGERDQVAIVVYAGASGVVLQPTSGDKQAAIREALDRLEAGGSTNGGEGIELAYSLAQHMARPGSSNRVILATDGDFNVGVTSQSQLFNLIEAKRKSGVFLSVLGFGMGNYKDSTLEMLADKGNGNYAYIDSLAEARKVLVAQGGATLATLAKDVKLQLEFNPAHVGAYRLIGYENRRLAARDFNDDAKDAGELGAGHSVTALYEIVPPGVPVAGGQVDPLRYQAPGKPSAGHGDELCTLKLRYKAPQSERSQLTEHVVKRDAAQLGATSPSFRFAAAVAVFGMTLRESPERGSSSFALARQLATGALGRDAEGYRREFVSLLDTADKLRR